MNEQNNVQQGSPLEETQAKVNREIMTLLHNVQKYHSPTNTHPQSSTLPSVPPLEALYQNQQKASPREMPKTIALENALKQQLKIAQSPTQAPAASTLPASFKPPTPTTNAYTFNSSVVLPKRRDTPIPEMLQQQQELQKRTPSPSSSPTSPTSTPPIAVPAPTVHSSGSSSLNLLQQRQQMQLQQHQQVQQTPPQDQEETEGEAVGSAETQPQVPVVAKGTVLVGENVVYAVTNQRNTMATTPITLYQTDPAFQFGSLIATNSSFMVYGIRGGLIRVINKFTAKRALLKGHKQQITDIKFMRDNQSYLATTSKDRTLIVWEIFNKKSPQSKTAPQPDEVGFTVVLYVKPSEAASNRYFTRVEWHPKRELELIVTTSTNEIYNFDINTMRRAAQDRILAFSPEAQGVSVIQDNQEEYINDIAFSRDGSFFAAGTEKGTLTIWDAENFSRLFSSRVFSDERPIYSINFTGSELRPVYNRIIVGGANNAEFIVLDLQTAENRITHLSKVQHLTLQSPNQMLNHVELDSSSSFLLVANMQEPTMYVLHLANSGTQGLVFDYIKEYDTQQPIISFISMTKVINDNNVIMGLFCVQTKSMQLLNLSSESCYPEAEVQEQKQQLAEAAEGENEEEEDAEEEAEEPADQGDEEAEDQGEPDNEQNDAYSAQEEAKEPEYQEDADENTEASTTSGTQVGTSSFAKMEKRMLDRMEKMLERFTEKQVRKIESKYEKERLERLKEERQRQEQLLIAISKTLTDEIPENLDRVVQKAVQESIVPALSKTFAQVAEKQIGGIVQQSMKKAIEQAFPRLEKSLVASVDTSIEQHLREAVNAAVAKSIQQPVKESFQQTLKSTVIPSFEQACQRMFEQIAVTFEKGLEEHIKKPLTDYYKELNQNTLASIENHLQELQSGLPVSPSQTTKPAKQKGSAKLTDKVSQLISAGKFEEAFTKILTTTDLSLVTWLCSKLDPNTLLLGPSKPLSQPVLLSLLQQLGYDLTAEVDLKIKWLQAVALSLNPHDPQIAHAVSPILNQVLENLGSSFKTYSQQNPSNIAQFQVVLHVINSLAKDSLRHAPKQ